MNLQTISADTTDSMQHQSCIEVGGVSLALVGESAAQVELPPQLQAFATEGRAGQIVVHVRRRERLPHIEAPLLFDSGSVWSLFADGPNHRFDFQSNVMGPEPYKRLWIDKDFAVGVLELRDGVTGAEGNTSPLEYPLDELLVMHRIALEGAVEVHACGLRDAESGGLLFVGHSGAGKSTTTRLWTSLRDVTVLSDDRIILRPSPEATEMFGTPWHGEACFAAALHTPVRAVFVLEHGTTNQVLPLSAHEAVAELFARSFVPFYDPDRLGATMSTLEQMVENTPMFRFRFVPDSSSVEEVLRSL